jgi:uncharacterized protein YegP (UPF0339 family)
METNRYEAEVFLREDNLFDWRLRAGNGEIVVASAQGYTEINDALEGFYRVCEAIEGGIVVKPEVAEA